MNYKKFIPAILILLLVIIIAIIAQKQNTNIETKNKQILQDQTPEPESAVREKLVKEFKGAYDKEITPNGNTVEIDMSAYEGEIEIFDGVKTKVWNYNGTVPGPEIRIKLGDTLKINFTNNLPQETTIHFHGVRVPNAMDGVPGVTQDPIKPGDKFIYEFTPKDAGTFWFHPHIRSSEQIERGLFGTLIVEDEYTEKYNQDILLVIDDWRLKNDKQIYENFNTPMDIMHDGRWGNTITVNGKLKETIDVKPGERIRVRMVNTSNARIYMPTIKNTKATVIAVDGMYVKKPFNLGKLELSPGNRIDVDITVPENGISEFNLVDTFTTNTIQLAKFKISGEKVKTPDFPYPTNPKVPDWNEAKYVSIDKEYKLNIERNQKGRLIWTINGKAYPDYEPYTFQSEKFNTMRFTNQSSRLHPMHLHGQFFKVIARDGQTVDEPYFRDTVLVYPKETIDVALVPLDKGVWVNHCHILEHAEAGMMTAVTVE